MASRWSHLKDDALQMRRNGVALREIERRLGIKKSTLHWWFRHIQLTAEQKQLLKVSADSALEKARIEAVKWHNAEKEKRLKHAANEGKTVLSKIPQEDNYLELALAFLYLGEGMKTTSTAMGNSNPEILQFFVSAMHKLYAIPYDRFKCELHLRDDQDPQTLIQFWSKTLRIPASNFGKSSIDKRTRGRATYPHYKGVCIVRCPSVAIQRKLMYISTEFCKRVS